MSTHIFKQTHSLIHCQYKKAFVKKTFLYWHLELVIGLEPTTCWLQISCTTSCAKKATTLLIASCWITKFKQVLVLPYVVNESLTLWPHSCIFHWIWNWWVEFKGQVLHLKYELHCIKSVTLSSNYLVWSHMTKYSLHLFCKRVLIIT